MQISTKVDPETGASVYVREDGLLKIDYADGSSYIQYPDRSIMHRIRHPAQNEDARVTQTYFEKEGYATVRVTFDPIKARA
jgi:hypothetical protein